MGDLELVMADVTRSHRSQTPIYDGTAKVIASWWYGGHSHAFTGLNMSGRIYMPELLAEIDGAIEYVRKSPANHWDAHKRVNDQGTRRHNLAALEALKVYVQYHKNRGPQEGWGRVWVDVLTPEDEYSILEGE
ncbi:hypothetical protein FDA94_28680 [Herbidospora galbida]|uniref:Uncharacterized protein n=1 Tax=Herbidospora galbida TaxID=2575442 RepID=A0A4U3MAB3_9ACTN|nr:hypothetical protein [Herbidospora galbida]TKK84607.1 hypothetical protein FDA94_28680 [Herbidospora galbida]